MRLISRTLTAQEPGDIRLVIDPATEQCTTGGSLYWTQCLITRPVGTGLWIIGWCRCRDGKCGSTSGWPECGGGKREIRVRHFSLAPVVEVPVVEAPVVEERWGSWMNQPFDIEKDHY